MIRVTRRGFRTGLAFSGLCGLFVLCSFAKVYAVNPHLEKAIEAFNQKRYNDAIGLLGEAKSTEFDDPTLHYYLATALLRTNQKADAIREYKIAYDLAPAGQLKTYCETSLRLLGALPALNAKTVATDAKTSSDKPEDKLIKPSQRPQVVSVLPAAGDHRIDMILTDLRTKVGDQVIFIRTVQGDNDPKTADLVKQINVEKTPTIVIIDSTGAISKKFEGFISEADIWRDVQEVAKTSPRTELSQSSNSMRQAIVDEVNSRIAHDQIRLDSEIRRVQETMRQDIADMSRRGRYGGYSAYDVAQVEADANAKIKALKDDFEKRESEYNNAANLKIQALESTASSSHRGSSK
jgi:hypothetical protein